ncbi:MULTISPECIES: hypothetical protein [unclassified Pseudoalteromonas]|uniref:hypothetical protein n=1 Tax=unclassified Pseudoalteromonas TaxID=194690 RepID=UPI0015F7988D|nr:MULTISPECIES: hypothetical protein [unclassified Pseudoalteromonas]MBB1291026.1 hypothetical protein [Pseudoalteromonas sp. SR41-5]MBB1415348.1 hypothetical protein [Pseudoalteromonas sp. SG43-8]
MSTLASLNIQIGGNSATLRKELTKAGKSVSNFAKNARSNMNTYAKAGLLAGGVVVGALLGIYKQQAAAIDQTAKFSDSIGIQTSALTELRHAAALSGVANKDLDKSLENMTRRTADAAFKGTGPLADTLKALQINAQDLNKLKPDEQLGVMAEALSGIESQSERTRIAYELFGKSGTGMLKVIEGGAAGIDAMRAEAVALGISLDRIDANKVEMANDSIERAESVFSSFSQNLATEAAPVIGSLADLFLENAKQAGGMGSYAADAVGTMVKGAGFVGNAWRGIQVIWQALKVSFNGLRLLVMEGANAMLSGMTSLGQHIIKTVVFPIQQALDAAGYFNDDAAKMAQSLASLSNFDAPQLFDKDETAAAYKSAQESTTALHNLMMEPIPSQNLEQWYADAKARFEGLAQTYVSTLNYNPSVAPAVSGETEDPAEETKNPYLAQITQAQEYFAVKKLMRENDWSEERAQLGVQLEEWRLALEAKKLTEDEYRLLSLQANEEFNAQRVEQNLTFMEQLREQAAQTSTDFDAMWGNTFDRFTQGIGESVANAVMTQQSFSDSMRSVMQGVVKSTIAALAEMGAKRLALWAIEKVLNKTTAVSAGTTMATSASAMALTAGLNAFASTAAIPIVGPIAAPAAMAAALAVATPMATAIGGISAGMAGMAHSGIDAIPNEGTWLLDKGERVYTNQSAQRIDEMYAMMSNQSQNQGGLTIAPNFNVTAMDTHGFDSWYEANKNRIATDMQDLIDRPM